MKQQTLEEFIEREGYPNGHTQDIWEDGVRRGINWQQERMYSEEEVLDLLAGFIDSRGKDFVPFKDIQKWFEQFKKK